MQTYAVFVQRNAHCNLDSLPLRFGFYFDSDRVIEITATSDELEANRPDRFIIEGIIKHPDTDENIFGKFVLTRSKRGDAHHLVTVWCREDDTEYYLSEVIRMLRINKQLDPDWLVENHRLYLAGELRTHADLVRLLALKISKENLLEVEGDVSRLIAQLDDLRKENERLKDELTRAKSAGNRVSVTERVILDQVETDVEYRGSQCTCLVLSDGKRWYMKADTFDRAGNITAKAQTLIGQPVTVTSWDPVSQPGRWSSLGYFRNVYASLEVGRAE